MTDSVVGGTAVRRSTAIWRTASGTGCRKVCTSAPNVVANWPPWPPNEARRCWRPPANAASPRREKTAERTAPLLDAARERGADLAQAALEQGDELATEARKRARAWRRH